ncbi:MAG: cobalamin biosynthesis protein P47K [Actinomycetia bacterium]|nr:cobalamin biosynthesis protein P47K [Actinomycetes bacterium]
MKIIILGGFLGSGKTTTLLSLAHYLVEHSSSDSDVKVMIIENEVGEIGIDDNFLRSGGLEVNTLFSGCACCTLSGELVVAAQKIERDYNPEWLIVETTGVAYPRSMQENLEHSVHSKAKIIILVDVMRWDRLMRAMPGLLTDQLQGSDAVLLNKIDLADADHIAAVQAAIAEIEPAAPIYQTVASQGIDDTVWQAISGE